MATKYAGPYDVVTVDGVDYTIGQSVPFGAEQRRVLERQEHYRFTDTPDSPVTPIALAENELTSAQAARVKLAQELVDSHSKPATVETKADDAIGPPNEFGVPETAPKKR